MIVLVLNDIILIDVYNIPAPQLMLMKWTDVQIDPFDIIQHSTTQLSPGVPQSTHRQLK